MQEVNADNPWSERLSECEKEAIQSFREALSPLIIAQLKNSGALELEYSPIHPGSEEGVPFGVIGDWYVRDHVVHSLENGHVLAHEISLTLDGFMRTDASGEFDESIEEHYETWQQAQEAGGTRSDVCWEYVVILNEGDNEMLARDDFVQWCGF